MVPKDVHVSGTYLLCNGNRIHKFRIKWCSRSIPTMEQVHEVKRVTEDIVKSNNLPQRITTQQLKIITKISFWTPRSKALSLRQFRPEKQGHLSAHKHSYVLMVFLADEKEQQDFEHLPTFRIIPSENGWENESQPFNVEKEVVETVANNTEFGRMDGIQLNIKAADAMINEDKTICHNLAHTKKSLEVILDEYDGEQQHVTRTSENGHNIVSRLEKLVERAVMAARVKQNEAMIVGHNSEQEASKAATDSLKTEIVGSNSTMDPTEEVHCDLEAGHKETTSSVNAEKNSSFPIMDAETICEDEKMFTRDKYITHLSPAKKFNAAHLQVVTSKWKFGNIKVSTDRSLERYDTSKATIHKKCPACNVHIHKLPVDCKEENIVAKSQTCELPLTVNSYSTLTYNNNTYNYKFPDNMSTFGEIVARHKRRRKRNASDICKVPNKKQMIIGGISPVILGPTSFQESSSYHTGVMSGYNALKTFESILGRTEGRNGIESSLPNFGRKLENWLMFRSVISRLRAVSRINNDTKLREIRKYVIRNLRNRSANMAVTQQSEKLVCSTPTIWMPDTHYDPHTRRALTMESEESETIMQDTLNGSGQSTLGEFGTGCYQNVSVVHMKSDSADNQQKSIHKQELKAFNTTVSVKQELIEENNSLQEKNHSSKICALAIEHIGESSDVQNVKIGSVATESKQPLKAETIEKLGHLVKCVATSGNLPNDKEKFEVEPSGVVQVFNFGDDFSGIVKPKCSPVKGPVEVHYDEVCIPNVSYCRSPHFSVINTVKQRESIGCSSDPVLLKGDNSLDTVSGSSSHLLMNSALKMDEHSLTKPTTNRTVDVSSEEILLNAALKLESLKELRTISSIRTLRKALVQQGVVRAIEQAKLSSVMYPKYSVPIYQQDFPRLQFTSSFNNTHKASSKLRSRTDKSVSGGYNTLDRFQRSFDTNVTFSSDTAGSLSDIYSLVLEDSVKNDCHTKNCSQNCKPQSFHRKTSKTFALPDPIVPPTHIKTTEAARLTRVKVGKLLSFSKIQVFLTTEIYANTDCPSRFSDFKPHFISPKSQILNVEGDLITAFLQYMAFNASQNACLTVSSQSSKTKQSLRGNISKRNKLPATSLIDCVVNSGKISQSHKYNFLKPTYPTIETTESVSPSFTHCKCPPSIKFQGVYASYSEMSSETKITGPRRQLIDLILRIKSNVTDRKNICDRQHCFYFHVDKEESVEGFYSTVEKYCSALSKFHSHQYNSSKSKEILLRDIWLPGQKYSISFYINLPLQKCKCRYCGLDTTVELCLNCGELFECTESGNYVRFQKNKIPELVDMKMEMDEAAAKVLNLVNDLYLCKPVVSISKQNKSTAHHFQ